MPDMRQHRTERQGRLGSDEPRQPMFEKTGGRAAAEHEVYKSIIVYIPFLFK
jgi:hypothetical protein